MKKRCAIVGHALLRMYMLSNDVYRERNSPEGIGFLRTEHRVAEQFIYTMHDFLPCRKGGAYQMAIRNSR